MEDAIMSTLDFLARRGSRFSEMEHRDESVSSTSEMEVRQETERFK